jgi:hypothetical protein
VADITPAHLTPVHLTPGDIRAAVAAGVLTEAQAASVLALAQRRAGQRAAMTEEDEPFEFFRGFSEIFVSIGLVILMAGVAMLLAWVGGPGILIAVPAGCAAVAWWWAGYFTLKRRMNLPSMVLATTFAGGVATAALTLATMADTAMRAGVIAAFLLTAAALWLWFRRFRLPFTMFLLGLGLLAAIYTATASVDELGGFVAGTRSGLDGLFDLRESPAFALATLGFGLAAFLAGMWFDMRDPYRLGRHAATAFWLHLLAAPALVNTVAVTLYNTGGWRGVGLLVVALAVITVLALVVDRRSFLTAAIAWIALVIAWVVQGGGEGDVGSWIVVLISLGAVVTAIGTWWVGLRAALMRALPDFPGKHRLPPYEKAA